MDVLIAENNEVFRKLYIKIYSQRVPLNPIFVSTSQEVLEYLANPANPRPRMIMLKAYLLDFGGAETARILRTDPRFAMDPILRATPIIGLFPCLFKSDFERNPYFDDLIPKYTKPDHIAKLLAYWSRRELAPPGPGPGMAFQPAWGPFPFRRHRGPRSPL